MLFDGTSWSARPGGIGINDVARIRTFSPTHSLAMGNFGVIRWDGTQWLPTARTTSVTSNWPDGPNTWWYLSGGELKWWDGTAFVDRSPWWPDSGLQFRDVVSSNGKTWLFGENCGVLRRQ